MVADISIATHVTHCGFVERKLVRAHAAVNLSTAALIFPRDLQRRSSQRRETDVAARCRCTRWINYPFRRRDVNIHAGAERPPVVVVVVVEMRLLIDRDFFLLFFSHTPHSIFNPTTVSTRRARGHSR